jgi:hypothetical protein
VAALLIDLLEDNRAHGMAPALRVVADFDGEVGDAQRHVDVAHDGWDGDLGHVVQGLVVDVGCCVRAGAREDVDADPEADFVFGPGVCVGPVDQFVPDPGEEADWGVLEGEVDGGGLLGWFG